MRTREDEMISMRYLVRIAVSVLLAMMPASALAAPATAPRPGVGEAGKYTYRDRSVSEHLHRCENGLRS
jgi:hypothetical protein